MSSNSRDIYMLIFRRQLRYVTMPLAAAMFFAPFRRCRFSHAYYRHSSSSPPARHRLTLLCRHRYLDQHLIVGGGGEGGGAPALITNGQR